MPAKHRFVRLGAALVLLAAAILSLFVTRAGPSAPAAANPGDVPMMAAPAGMPPASAEEDAADPEALRAGQSLFNDTSPALRDIMPIPAEAWTTPRQMPEVDPLGTDKLQREVKDSVLQSTFGALDAPLAMPVPSRNFAGLTNVNGVYPPDTSGEAGPNHYMQWVNLSFAIYDKATGTRVYGPANGNTLWSGFGGACASQNAGDPIVLYDQAAGRWVVSQFTSSSPYGECVAVSTSSDPTGSWYRYFFQHSTSIFYDYPHMGVWPDGYYTTFNKFRCRGFCTYQGAAVVVYDRAKMLLGQPAGFQEKGLSSSYGYPLPSDWDGTAAPPTGRPNFLVARNGTTALNLWKFSVNWANPASSALTGPTTLGVAAYNQLCSGTRTCIPQPGTSQKVDGIGDRPMFRLAYRNMGTYETLVANHSVDVDSSSAVRAGVRWYEIRNPNGTATVHQQGTYAPADGLNRWMGSIAMDKQGNIALGYSVSSSSVYPSIRYTGRLVTDPLGQLPQGEVNLVSGSGSQTGTGARWGDYSHMSIDPTDDCTFWYTTEYVATTGTASWITRIGSFTFPGCTP
jgi:hypothetical protein